MRGGGGLPPSRKSESGMDDYNNKTCGSCLLCIATNMGCECSITDNDVEQGQKACIDYLPAEEDE